MSTHELINTHVVSEQTLLTPDQLREQFPLQAEAAETIWQGRQTIRNILHKKDSRLLVVVGPCSIHDVDAAKEYALKLKTLSEELNDSLFLVMRIYFEKPRTTVGWKGLINDPDMDDSFHIERGLKKARELLVWLADNGVLAATEALDPISPQYLAELFSWAAIGARTTESQTHRELASGLSMPVGFKNGTDGGLGVAINALQSVANPHRFLGINTEGQVAVIHTLGNDSGHVILRGGSAGPNYDSVHINLCETALRAAGLNESIVIDCSHGNSNKQHELQPLVAHNAANQIIEGNQSITGIMLESHLKDGNQSIPKDLSQLEYGVSVTDACIDWDTTETTLREIAEKLRKPQV